jgi:hypothetical protein
MPGRAWCIALPFEARPLAAIPSRHRKRAARRRAYWQGIGDAAREVLSRHLTAQAHKQNGRRPQERRPLQPS